MNNKILLIGAGGHASTIIDIIERDLDFEIAGLISKLITKDKLCGYEIIGTDKDLPLLRKNFNNAFISFGHFGNAINRIKLQELLEKLEYTLPNIISKFSNVSKYSSIGKGNYFGNGVCVNANSIVGNNCILNSNSLIEHDCKIGDHTHISTGVLINGGVTIGPGSFIGSGTIIREGLELPSNTIISAGKRIMGWPLK